MTDAFEKWLETQPVVHDVEQLRAAWDAALEWARTQQEPVAWEFQHEERGDIEYVCPQQVEWGYEKNNPRWQKIKPVYTHPAPALNAWEADKGYTLDYSIHSNPSASVWAEAFCKQFPNSGADEGLMVGWFANAMMAMYDHLKTQEQSDVSELISEVEYLIQVIDDSEGIAWSRSGVIQDWETISQLDDVKEALAKLEGKR